MDKKNLSSYRANKRLLERLKEKVAEEERREVPVVQGKVIGSMHEHPYIQRSFSVEMEEPLEADIRDKRIGDYQRQMKRLEDEIKQVETFIAGIEDSRDREVFELYYTEGNERMSQEKIAEKVGYAQCSVSRIIKKYERCIK